MAFGRRYIEQMPLQRNAHWQQVDMARYLNRMAGIGVASVVLMAPIFLGGRHPIGRFALVAIVALTTISWGLSRLLQQERKWRITGAEPLIAAGFLLICLQLATLGPDVLAFVSPHHAEALPLWTNGNESSINLGNWTSITLDREATRAGAVMFVTYALLFVVTTQWIQRTEDIERILGWIAMSAIAMAILGLAQFLLSNGKFLWFYEHPSRDTYGSVKATFVNPNHFAHFLALGIGPLLWLLRRSYLRTASETDESFGKRESTHGRDQLVKASLTIAAGFVAFAGLLSFSRAGCVVIVAASAVCLLVYSRSAVKSYTYLLAIVCAIAFIGVGLTIFGGEYLSRQMDTLWSGSFEEMDSQGNRRKLWSVVLDGIQDYPILGTGVGSHREVYPTYMKEYSPVEYTHAENGYLQILLETGATGLLLFTLGIGLALYWAWRAYVQCSAQSEWACWAPLVAGVLVSVIHSITDFVWYIPACMSLTVLLLACICRLSQLTAKSELRWMREVFLPRNTWRIVTPVLIVLAICLVSDRLGPAMAAPHWDEYRMISLAAKDVVLADVRANEERDSHDVEAATTTQSMIASLQRVLRWYPNHPRANLRLAALQLRYFEHQQRRSDNAMGLAQIRDAAIVSRFPSREAQEKWLEAAIGNNLSNLFSALSHTLRGLKASPLQGQAYLYLAELSFLEGQGDNAKSAYIEQALRLRPHEGSVLFAAGREAALSGDIEVALKHWRTAFRQGPVYQRQVIDRLGTQLPAPFFLTFFEPDLGGMKCLYRHYRDHNLPEHMQILGEALAPQLEEMAIGGSDDRSANLWRDAHNIYLNLGNHRRAIECIRQAVALHPYDYRLHYNLAQRLLEQEAYDEAIEEFRWCMRRKPDDKSVQKRLDLARRKKLTARPSNLSSDNLNKSQSRYSWLLED